jgi:hypothetical protein
MDADDACSAHAAVAAQRARELTPAESAWIALIPCAIVTVVAILVLGPPIGHAFLGPGSAALWPPGWEEAQGTPEPVKHARYVIAVLAPLLLVAVVLTSARRKLTLRPQTIRAVMLTSQAAVLAFVIFAVLGQHDVILVGRQLPPIFGIGTLVLAAALVLAAVLAMRGWGTPERIARLARERTPLRAACVMIAAAVAVLWLLEGVYTDRVEDAGVVDWTVNDAFAVLNGRTPLFNYHILYAKLLPYPAALSLEVFGKTTLVYTMTMAVLSVLALVAVYAVFRRILNSSLLALGLFVPFVATSDIDHPMILTAMWPMRYGGAFLLAWLTTRHLDRRGPRQAWVLFFVAAIVALNNLEFGAGASLATAVALLCARPPRSVRAALPLVGHVAGGVLGGVALVSLFTLLRAGALPDPALLFEWPRIFTRLGWFSMPMPDASLHLVLYATFVATIAVAVARAMRPDEDVLLTGMLAWSGVFGLVAGSYYVGRSDDLKLVSMFSAWSFALCLLTIVVARGLAAQRWRRPTLPQLLVLFGFGLSVCAISRVTPPQRPISMLTKSAPPPAHRPAAERFLRAHTHRRQKVVILLRMGYRIAYDIGLENVSPYGTQEAIVTRFQLQTVIDMARSEHAHAIFLPSERVDSKQLDMLRAAGFALRAQQGTIIELADG